MAPRQATAAHARNAVAIPDGSNSSRSCRNSSAGSSNITAIASSIRRCSRHSFHNRDRIIACLLSSRDKGLENFIQIQTAFFLNDSLQSRSDFCHVACSLTTASARAVLPHTSSTPSTSRRCRARARRRDR